MLGDININLLLATNNDTEYLCLMAEHGLTPAITGSRRGNACLDYIFVNTFKNAIGVICSSDITDHDLALLGLTIKKSEQKLKDRTVLKRDMTSIKTNCLR